MESVVKEMEDDLAVAHSEWIKWGIISSWKDTMRASERILSECGFKTRTEVRALANKYGRRVA